MNAVFMFPGQGSQVLGMGKDLYESVPFIKDKIEKASSVSKLDLPYYMFESNKEEMIQPEIAQISLYTLSTAIAMYLVEEGIQPWAVVGHSLGEYSSLVIAGSLRWEQGLELLLQRSEAMRKVNERNKGRMAAIMGLDESVVAEMCSEISSHLGEVCIANYNCPKQTVVSGQARAVEEVVQRARDARAIADVIHVQGACHSPLMENAQHELTYRIDKLTMSPPTCTFISSINGEKILDINTYQALFKHQITLPVYWEKAIKKCVELGAEQFVEVGPGRILTSLVKGVDRYLNVISIGDVHSLHQYMNQYTLSS
ncbi:ACP S-malonyltransferase [Chengkuizengella marina]|uniref:Malonyl CoA-acyl carrier protein transacylase n=1 Tax=Chengkuizengella marina TaxID=2507566 RepID=A0A6N9Q886_9BACL|nr:ACP S-malonyltransferase [Chengkuizengella marina]NBI31087.1 ACP S-malonyltransferase [Chengkuizengella marina]